MYYNAADRYCCLIITKDGTNFMTCCVKVILIMGWLQGPHQFMKLVQMAISGYYMSLLLLIVWACCDSLSNNNCLMMILLLNSMNIFS